MIPATALNSLPEELWQQIGARSDNITASALLLARHWRLYTSSHRRFRLAQQALSRKLKFPHHAAYTERDPALRKSQTDAYVEVEVGRYLLVRRIVDVRPARSAGKNAVREGVVHQRLYVHKPGFTGGWERGVDGTPSCYHFRNRCCF